MPGTSAESPYRHGEITIDSTRFDGPVCLDGPLPTGPGLLLVLDVLRDGSWRPLGAHHVPRLEDFVDSPKRPYWVAQAQGNAMFATWRTEKWVDQRAMDLMFAIRQGLPEDTWHGHPSYPREDGLPPREDADH